MRRWHKWLLIPVFVLALLAVSLNLESPSNERGEEDTALTASDDASAPDLANEESAATKAARGSTQTRTTSGDSPTSTIRQPTSTFALDEKVRMGSWLVQFQGSVREAQPGDFDWYQQKAEEQDPDAAFWLHEFYKYCDDVPRSDWQLDSALSRTEQRVERTTSNNGYGGERRLQRAQNRLDWYEQGYELCSFLGADFDTKAASLAWLEMAANLGHMAALRLYHSQARLLLTEDDSTLGFQQPDLIHLFKSNARNYARQLLATGHPQGYFLMARMYYIGDVFQRDYLTAYAYARAGYLVGTAGAQADGQMWMRLIGQHLPPADLPQADRLANEILSEN